LSQRLFKVLFKLMRPTVLSDFLCFFFCLILFFLCYVRSVSLQPPPRVIYLFLRTL
jgi:hypothetical protein